MFDISVTHEGLDTWQADVFETALGRWRRAILGYRASGSEPSAAGTLKLTVRVTRLPQASGPLRRVARAEPANLVLHGGKGVRANLPKEATIYVDQSHLKLFPTHIPDFRDIFSHEIGHALGLMNKTLSRFPFVRKGADGKTLFTGGRTLEVYRELWQARHESTVGIHDGVPIDCSLDHWDELLFGNELMTPRQDSQHGEFQALSRLTLAALHDIGYEVDMEQADPYRLP